MAYEMKGSPAKRGDIEGTSGHASALKAGWLLRQGAKHGPKIVQGIKNLFRSGKNVSKKSEDFWKGIKSHTKKGTDGVAYQGTPTVKQTITEGYHGNIHHGGKTNIVTTTGPGGRHTVEIGQKSGKVLAEGGTSNVSQVSKYPRVKPGTVSKIPNTTTLASGEVIPFDPTKRQMLDPAELLK